MGALLKRLSILALLGFPVAVLGTRLGFYDFRIGFSILKYSVFLAAVLFLLGMVLSFVHRKSKPDSAKASRFAAYVCLIPLLGIGSQIVTARSVPFIHDISTDVVNPPRFNKVIALRGEGTNSLKYDSEKNGALQLDAYPKVKTLIVDAPVTEAYAKALSVVVDLGWELVNDDSEAGIIEATETSRLWAFKDDIVVRVSAVEKNSAIDLRSVSRVGQSDLGANARRIEMFLKAYQH